MEYKRILKQGMTGSDVRYVKNLLFELNYYNSSIKEITHNIFGKDTTEAVKNFQEKNYDSSKKKLVVDGIVGKKTWDSLVEVSKIKKDETLTKQHPILKPKSYPNISKDKLALISKDLRLVSDIRYNIVTEILHYAYDHAVGGDIQALYMWGANLYNSDLKLNIATKEKIESGAKKYPQYYSNSRKEMMLEAVKKNPSLPASDCSGFEVGYLRKHKFVKNTFDTTANGLCSDSYSSSIDIKDLKPGDWVGYSGHIGTYVGGGYVVEFAGGSYGCQLTELNNRRLYSFVTQNLNKGSLWTKFRDPKYY